MKERSTSNCHKILCFHIIGCTTRKTNLTNKYGIVQYHIISHASEASNKKRSNRFFRDKCHKKNSVE